jgi:hypothetical protein
MLLAARVIAAVVLSPVIVLALVLRQVAVAWEALRALARPRLGSSGVRE